MDNQINLTPTESQQPPANSTVSPWLLSLYNVLSQQDGYEKQRLRNVRGYTRQLGLDACMENLQLTLEASLKEHARTAASTPNYSQTTRDLVLQFVIQASQELFSIEDSLIQRAMILFDHCLGLLDPDSDDELLLYHLVSSIYLTLKVENQTFADNCSFVDFLTLIVQLPAYEALRGHLAPHLQELGWHSELYLRLEYQFLAVLRWNTHLHSGAEVIYQIVATFAEAGTQDTLVDLGHLLQEAIIRSYCALQDFKPAEYSSLAIAIACLQSALDQDSQRVKLPAFSQFLVQVLKSTPISKETIESLQKHLDGKIKLLVKADLVQLSLKPAKQSSYCLQTPVSFQKTCTTTVHNSPGFKSIYDGQETMVNEFQPFQDEGGLCDAIFSVTDEYSPNFKRQQSMQMSETYGRMATAATLGPPLNVMRQVSIGTTLIEKPQFNHERDFQIEMCDVMDHQETKPCCRDKTIKKPKVFDSKHGIHKAPRVSKKDLTDKKLSLNRMDQTNCDRSNFSVNQVNSIKLADPGATPTLQSSEVSSDAMDLACEETL